MKTWALGFAVCVTCAGLTRADIPRERPTAENAADGSTPLAPIVAGVALAAALGVGGVLAVKHVRDSKEKSKSAEVDPAAAPSPAAGPSPAVGAEAK